MSNPITVNISTGNTVSYDISKYLTNTLAISCPL